jgi:carbon-monoxide dehydrogenase medium subunit
MLALGAALDIAGPTGRRTVKADDFFKDLFTVDLAANEIIAAVHVNPVRTAAYAKLYHRASHYAIVGVAAALDVESGTIRSARVGLTGASSHAQRLTNVEQALAGRPATADTIDAAVKQAGESVENVNSDIHAGEAYRRAMIGVFTRRALTAALART